MENTAKLKVLDLFAGAGGFTVAGELAGGYETVAFCEIDKHARKVLAKNWPDVPIFEDVTKLKADDIDGAVDVITGGFPCQDLSTAGRGAGLGEGTRSGLFRKCYDWLAKYGKSKGDFHISSLRMSRGFSADLRKRLVNGLASFSGPWPKSGMMRSGFVSPLPALARRMSGSVSALLPTPQATDGPKFYYNMSTGAALKRMNSGSQSMMAHYMVNALGRSGNVGPVFSELIMGFQANHTDLN